MNFRKKKPNASNNKEQPPITSFRYRRDFSPVPPRLEAIRLDFFQAEAFLMRAKVRSRQKAQEDLKAPQVPPESGSCWVFL